MVFGVAAVAVGAGAVRADPPATIDPTVAALVAKVDDVAKEVAKVRGLPLKKKIASDVVDRDQLKARLVKLANEDKTKAQTAAEGLALKRWGLVPGDVDYEALVIGVLDDQIAGYYDPKIKQMTFVSSSVSSDPTWGELVLAHELDHALQDQSFDLEKYETVPDDVGDASTARHAVVEGDGIALMIEVLLARNGTTAPWSNPAIASLIAKEMAEPGNGDSLDRAPVVLHDQMVFPYRAGFTFVAALRRTQPWSAIDAVFARPPRSTEQVLHPERYLADEIPTAITIAPPPALAAAGFAVAHSTVWGELGVSGFLRTHGIADVVATEAADGWGGDRVVVLARGAASGGNAVTDPRRAIGLARSAWDTEADASEAADALEHALDEAIVGATVHHDDTRTTWLALDGTTAWIERRGTDVAFAIGVPAWATAAVQAQLWTSSTSAPGKK